MLGIFRRSKWAARLGLFALALNLLVPIHMAFDLAEAQAAARPSPAHAAKEGAEWHLFAALSGHLGEDESGGKPPAHGKAHHDLCPVCAAASTLAGFAPAPPAAALPLPPPPATAATAALPERVAAALPSLYRSRAPPAS